LKKLEELHYNSASAEQLTKAICAHTGTKQMLKLLSLNDKNIDTYEKLVFRDTLLSIRSIEFGSIKYLG